MKQILIRITTVPISLDKLLEGQLSFMKEHYDVLAVSSGQEHLDKVGEKEGVATYCIEMSRKITPLKDLKAVWEHYRLFRKHRPFIVHTHTPKAGIVGMLAAWLAGVPNRLHTVAGLPLLEARGMKRTLLNVVEKATYACATQVYPNSKGLKQIILDAGLCGENKLKVIGNGSSNGINTTYFDPTQFPEEQRSTVREELGIREEDFVFLFIGRLVSDKGINELVKAFERLNREYKNSKLVLVGPLEPDLDPLAEDTLHRIKENGDILSVGYQKDVRPYLLIADLLVFPSYREGFPNVVMQAGAMGVPAIVTDINGCNEIIIDEKNGMIIPVKDTDAIYQKMKMFIADPVLVKQQSAMARDLILSRYEQKRVWNALLEEYKSLEKTVQHVQASWEAGN
ncbi:MAG: glycosyltransferase family 4 protein [Tannerellaceae bacterium]|nr:glycosyltransferase family 4 protein [Tannerellaceae bacterium]